MHSKCTVLFILNLFLTFVTCNYRAAVVEYFPLSLDNPYHTIERNLVEYRIYLNKAKQNNVSIIVFPEYGLTGLIDDPTNYSIQIPDVGTETQDLTEYILQSISEAAREHNMYIVFNIAENSTDAKNKTVYYNTNVVFDRRGKIVAKYRKINLYDEPKFTPGSIDDIEKAVFVTDFGRTFGTFICFDIAFYNPSRKILSLNVTDIVYPTAWYSVLPFYHSLSFHQAYAAENKVNLLVANINAVKDGQGGSGIYGSDGTVYGYYLSGSSSSQIIFSTVNTLSMVRGIFFPDDGLVTHEQELLGYNTSYYFQANDYKFKLIDLAKGNLTERICDGLFCCDFTLSSRPSDNQKSAIYQLMAYRGPIMLGPNVYGPTKMCFLLACESRNPNTCGTRNVTTTASFLDMTVQTVIGDEPQQYYVPVTLTTDLLPVFNSSYDYFVENGRKQIELHNGVIQNKVLVFGIFSNGVEQLSISRSCAIIVLLTLVKYFL